VGQMVRGGFTAHHGRKAKRGGISIFAQGPKQELEPGAAACIPCGFLSESFQRCW
jgi:hypothetical protein